MPKNIVLLSDGTGNSAAQIWKTNVWRVYQALDLSDGAQIARYDDGVGSSSFKPLALLGGIFGWGLKRNVLNLYRFVCRTYKPGDKIYGFGFSRGAFTIRVVAALILDQGLVRFEDERQLHADAKRAYRAYRRQRYRPNHPIVTLFRRIRDGGVSIGDSAAKVSASLRGEKEAKKTSAPRRPKIEFLGLWDTVEAYGLPIEEMRRAVDFFWPLAFPDRRLHRDVKRACHALSLDDDRLTFHPVLWTEAGQRPAPHIRRERISQVWFAGVHANVGGGYPDDALAHVPLHWIMGEAEHHGLRFKPGARAAVRDAAARSGRMYDSRRGVARYYRYAPRKLESLCRDTVNGVEILRPKVHESAFARIRSGSESYAPIGLPKDYAVVRESGAVLHGGRNTFEHPDQSAARAREQEKVWNGVWWKRIAYFASLVPTLYLLLFALLHPAARDGACSGQFCFLSAPIAWLGALLPAFLSPWLAAFQTHPGKFALIVLALVASLWCSRELKFTIANGMRAIWRPIVRSGPRPVPPVPEPNDWLYRLRTSGPYRRAHSFAKFKLLPFLFVLLFLYVGAVAFTRGVFLMASSTGMVCSETELRPARFLSSQICWNSGLPVTEGARYRLTIALDPAFPWKDAWIETGLAGFNFRDKAPPVMLLGVPLRRWISQNWFQPIARIGVTGTDEYVLESVHGVGRGEKLRVLVADFTARSSGTLFLYVNDAVFLWPRPGAGGWFGYFYENNEGAADVTLTRLRPDAAQD